MNEELEMIDEVETVEIKVIPYTEGQILRMIRDALVNGDTDLFFKGDDVPLRRNVNRKLEKVDPTIWTQVQIIPDEVLLRLIARICEGTPHTRHLCEFEEYLEYRKQKGFGQRLDLDAAIEKAENVADYQPNKTIFEDHPTSQFVFQPFDLDWEVSTKEIVTGETLSGKFRVHVYRARASSPMGSGLILHLRRIVPVIPTPIELGFSRPVMNFINLLKTERIISGLFVVTGKTNSGKSTTVAAIVKTLADTRAEHIVILEDPPEYDHADGMARIDQIHVGRDVRTYAEGAHHVLRQDCDIVVIGEIRDKETAKRGLQLAREGHLVIATLHSSTNAAEATARLIQWLDYDQTAIGTHVLAIIAQKLVEPKDVYDKEGNVNPPVLIQEIVCPFKNLAIQQLINSRNTIPYRYFQEIGKADEIDPVTGSVGMKYEQTFKEALNEAVKEGKIEAKLLIRLTERDEEEMVLNTLNELKNTKNLEDKARRLGFLQPENEATTNPPE